jgi:hypothetical protein
MSSDLLSYLLPREVNIMKDASVSGQLNMSNWMSLYVELYEPITCLHFILFCLCNCVVFVYLCICVFVYSCIRVFVYLCIRAGCIIGSMRLKMQVNKIKSIY